MEIEPLPRVTFLPAQLTQLVIENWTGDIIDYEKNGQVRNPSIIDSFRFAKFTMARARASLRMDMSIKENCDTAFFTARVLSNGLTAQCTRVNSARMK
jgi:hypothetical protein